MYAATEGPNVKWGFGHHCPPLRWRRPCSKVKYLGVLLHASLKNDNDTQRQILLYSAANELSAILQ